MRPRAYLGQWADGNAHDPIVLLAGSLPLGLVAGIACAITARLSRRSNDSAALQLMDLTKSGDQVCAAACPRKKNFHPGFCVPSHSVPNMTIRERNLTY
jgi:hypothetical protein